MTKNELKEILDKVWNDGQPVERYSGDGHNGIVMYMNSKEKNSAILTITSNGNKHIVAIVEPDVESYQSGQDQKELTFKAMKDADIYNSTLREYNRGIALYVPMEQIIRQMSAFLGLRMSASFNTINPAVYSDLVSIVKKYTGLENKCIAFQGKYAEAGNVVKYRSYVPEMILYEMCIYFQDLGVYTGRFIAWNYDFVPYYSPIAKFEKIGEIFSDFLNVEKFLKLMESYPGYDNNMEMALGLFALQFSDDIDFNNHLIALSCFNNVNTIDIKAYQIPLSCKFNLRSSSYGRVTNNDSNFTTKTFTFSYNVNTHQTTHTINTEQHTKDTVISLSFNNWMFLNAKFNWIKTYTNNDTQQYPAHDSYSILPVGYSQFSHLHTLKDPFFFSVRSAGASAEIYLYNYIKSNINIGSKDLVYLFSKESTYSGVNHIKIVIIRNCDKIKFTSDIPSNMRQSIVGSYNYYIQELGTYRKISSLQTIGYSQNSVLTFDGNKTVDIYGITNANTNYKEYESENPGHISVTDSSIRLQTILDLSSSGQQSLYIMGNNLGQLMNFQIADFDGLTRFEGETMPTNVTDLSSFELFYGSAFRHEIGNPQYLGTSELQDTLNYETWVACKVDNNIATSSNNAINDNDVDDLTQDGIDDITKSIEDADDNDDSDSDDNKNKSDDDTGDMPDVADLPNGAGMIKYYVLTFAQLQEFYSTMTTSSFWHNADNLFNNPLEAIISLQAGHYYQNLGEHHESLKINGVEYGGGLSSVIRMYNTTTSTIFLGSRKVIGETQSNDYRDLENCYLQLYLPFVGVVDLDFKTFYNKYLAIQCRIDCTCGSITYSIYCQKTQGAKKNSKKYEGKLIATYNGVCQQQFALKQDSFMNLINGLLPFRG